MTDLPKHAQVVVVGGGIVGCSTAYHLAKLGWTDIVLLERASLTSGSTFHAAGLVGQLRSSANVTQLLKYSVELYGKLEAETGHATGWKANGGLRLACNDERWTEVRRQATTAHSFGLEMELLTPAEAKQLWPLMEVDDLVGAAFLPTDGQVSPSDLSQAMVAGARNTGVRCIEDCAVTGVLLEDGPRRPRVVGVQTVHGEIRCDRVVNCAGLWAREFGALAGVNVPVQAVQHQFMVSEPIEGVARDLPTLRDPDRLVYFKEEVGGLIMGGYELDPIPWAIGGVPDGWTFKLIEPNWEHFASLAEQAMVRVPALESVGARQLVNGPEAFTPDGTFILGQAPEVENYFVGAGFNAFGIAAAGGAGRALAEWIVGGEPPMDLWPVDIRRFGGHHRDIDWCRERTLEAYSHHYTMSWPHEEHLSGRPRKKSPLYHRLTRARACFGEKLGWERPNWFAPVGVEPRDEYTYGRPNWFDAVGDEHRAVRERVAVFDQTSFAKFEVTGTDAVAAMQWLCANDADRPVGSMIYTQMCNERGGIECDLTVARTGDDRFYIVTGTGYATHDFDWIGRNIPAGLDVSLDDVTDAHAVLVLMGPQARDVLEQVAVDNVSNEAFPFMTCRDLHIAGYEVRALRVTFVGELGWELHVPVGGADAVYEVLFAAGTAHGIANAGYRAIESLRLEKGYRVWSRDITPDDTPFDAGLGFAVKLEKGTECLGHASLVASKAAGPDKRFAAFTLEDPSIVLLGRETIYRDGKRCGWLSSGGYGYTIGAPIGLGYIRGVRTEDVASLGQSSYELDVAGQRLPCSVHFKPLYDPRLARVRG